jgi:uncharacterized protein
MYVQLVMNIEWDESKRISNFTKHGLDFRDVHICFDNLILEKIDDRKEYSEMRYTALALFLGRVVNLVFTKRGENLRIISFRKANERETNVYTQRLESS